VIAEACGVLECPPAALRVWAGWRVHVAHVGLQCCPDWKSRHVVAVAWVRAHVAGCWA
jgi:hypothetical protein